MSNLDISGSVSVKAAKASAATARQRLLHTSIDEEEKWYKGDTPTTSETLARVYTIAQSNPNKGEALWNAYLQFADDPSSPVYNPYTRPTNPAISQIGALGVDISKGVDKNWLDTNAVLKSFYRLGTGGTPLAPAKGSTPENDAAYWYYKISSAEDTTQRAETEWDALQEELSYWVGYTARNYSDDEVLAKVDWADYPALTKMDEGRKEGLPLPLNRSVGYSQDAMNGVIWAARNNGGTGNALADSVKYAMGEGNLWSENKDISARLNPASDRYNPYAVGSTLDDAGLYFGVYGFDDAWLEENRALLSSGDQTAVKFYQTVYAAEQLTKQAEAELTKLQSTVDRYLSVTNDADKVLSYIDMSEYPTLKKMDESLKSGDLLAFTRAVDYRWQNIDASVRKRCSEKVDLNSGYTAGVADDLGLAFAEAGVDLALINTRNKLLSTAGIDIFEVGTPEELKVFQVAGDAGFDYGVDLIRKGIMNGTTDAAKAYAASLKSFDAYAGDHYLPAVEATRAYEAAVNTRDQAKQELDALLGANPALALFPEVGKLTSQEIAFADEEAYIQARHEAETVWKPLQESIKGYGEVGEYPEMVEWHDLLYIDHKLHNSGEPFDFEAVDALYSEEVMDDATYKAAVDRLRKQRDGLDWATLTNPETADAKRVNKQAELWLAADALINGTPVPEDTTNISAEEWERLEAQYNTIDWADGAKMVKLQNTVGKQDALAKELFPDYEKGLTELQGVKKQYEDTAKFAKAVGLEAEDRYQTLALLDYAYQYGSTYKPTEWSAYTMYDAALNEGYDYAQVSGAAKQGVEQYKAQLDTLNLMVSELDARGIKLDKSYVENIGREIALIERNIRDAEYFMLAENEDFDRVVEETRQKVIDAWSGFNMLPTFVDRNGYSELSYDAADPLASVDRNNGRPRSMFYAADEGESDRYLYILGTQGEEAARAYYNHLADETYGILTVRTSETARQRWEELASENAASATGMTVLSVISSPFQVAGTLYSGIASLKGEEINPYHGSFGANILVNETRSTVKENINEALGPDSLGAKAATIAYDAVTGAGDSLAGVGMFGGFNAVAMSLSSAGSATREAKLAGADDSRARKEGFFAGAAEFGSEWVSNRKILKLFKNPPENLTEAFSHAVVDSLKESSFETLGDVANQAASYITDEITGQTLSQYNQLVEQYEANDIPTEDAEAKAYEDTMKGFANTFFTSMVSSGLTSTAAAAAGSLTKHDATAKATEPAAEAPTLPTSPDVVEAPQPNQQTADMLARQISALDHAITSGRDIDAAATISAAIASDDSHDEAEAAGQHMTALYGGEKAAQVTKDIMLNGAVENVDTDQIGPAIATAVLVEGEARGVLDSIVGHGATPEAVHALISAAQHDMGTPGSLAKLQTAVTENQVANRVKEIIADGGLNGLQAYESSVTQAQQNLDNANGNLKQAEDHLNTSSQNLSMVSGQYLADPGNVSMRGAVQQATKDMESAAIVHKQMEQSVQKYDIQLQEAKRNRNSVRDELMKGIREQAVADVAAKQQEAVAAREQKAADAEAQRLNGNVAALEAENFISENGYEGIDDIQLDQVRQEVVSTAQPLDVEKAGVAFISQMSKRFKVPIDVGDLEGGALGAYDSSKGRLKISRNATQSEVIFKVAAHELTHRAENSRHYKELAETLLQLQYGDDTAARQADLDAIKAQYADVYTEDVDFESELVTHAAENILGNEENMARVVAEKPSIARRVWESLKSFINKMRGVNDPAMDTLRRAEKLLEKSLDEMAKKAKEGRTEGGLQYKLTPNPDTDNAEQYSYEYLTSQPDMVVAKMPEQSLYEKEKGADRTKARKDGIQNSREIQSAVSNAERLFVDNVYTGRPLQINEQSVQHGIFGSKDRQLRNAAAGSIVGDLAANAIPVNGLVHAKTDSQPWVRDEQLYISLAEDAESYYPVALVVQTTNDDLGVVTHVEALEGINKQYVYSLNAHQHKKEAGYEGMTAKRGGTSASFTGIGSDGMATSQRDSTSTNSNNSISDTPDDVNKKFAETEGAGYEVKTAQGGGTSADSTGTGYEDMTVDTGSTSTDSSISITDLLDLVKDDFGDGFSSDVLQHLGMDRPSGQFSKGVKYMLPSKDLRQAQLNAWRNSPAPLQGQEGSPDRAERQFAAQTAQTSQAMPLELRQELLDNDVQHYYDTDTNRAQLDRAWQQYQQDGFEASRDRILQAEHLTTDDIAMSNLLMALAFRSGDVNSAMELAHRYNLEGTAQGQALQARKLFSRMTPTGARAWVAGGMETQLAEHMNTHQRQRRQIDANAEQVVNDIRDMQNGDEVARLLSQREFTIDETNNRWGVPINEQQQALIDQYHLNRVRRPGVFYNRATTQQRMLEAILATPNPLELTGNGLNLIQRLEYMQAGEAVVTNADLDYIGMHLAAFAASDADTQGSREGDLHLSRAYEAYGNITPATGREKARTWRYTSMLLSLPSATRNVIGNALQNTINATSHGLAVELDRIASLVTGERTTTHLSAAERAEGWHSFVEETQNTFRDFFIDRSITETGEDRYNLNQRGRVFQAQIPEAMRLVEGYLMSVGDRNFWRKAYVNSMAEQLRVADLNSVELDYDAAVERATAEANFATFTEESPVRDALGALKQIPVVGDVLDFVIPFTGVPTNIVKRMWQYSPAGLATSAIRHGWRGVTGQDFNQLDFVNSMARGLTGTALFAVGMALGNLGYIELGTGEEEDQKVYGIESAQGKQYAPYVKVGDEYISLSAFAPAVTPFIMGATANELFSEDTNAWNALYNAALSGFDQILDASYMSNLKDIFGGYGSTSENIGHTVLSSAISQNIPSVVSQLALALDPYVRDTKEKDSLMEILNAGLIQKIPFLRETLPEKVDVAGRSVESKEGLRNFFDPLTTTNVIDEPALNELMRLYDAHGSSAGFPMDALSGRKNSLTGVLGEVEGENKEAYRKRYGELWRLGGTTFDEDGNRVTLTGVTELIQTPAYKAMTDKEKMEAISGIVEAAKTGAVYEMGEKLGHAPKASSSSSDGYKKQAVRAMPERFAQSESPWMQELATWYEKTGDGAFIPKGIGSSFSRKSIKYNLTGDDYNELWDLYEIELNARLAKINWLESAEDVAQAVTKAYSNAADSAKDKYTNTHK